MCRADAACQQPASQRRLVDALLAASRTGDLTKLEAVLVMDIVWSPGNVAGSPSAVGEPLLSCCEAAAVALVVLA